MARILPGSKRAAKFVRRAGRGFQAHFPGAPPVMLGGPLGGAFGPDTQYDPGDGNPMVSLVKAYLARALPPELQNFIDQLVQGFLGLQNVHDYAVSNQSLNDIQGIGSPPPMDAATMRPPTADLLEAAGMGGAPSAQASVGPLTSPGAPSLPPPSVGAGLPGAQPPLAA